MNQHTLNSTAATEPKEIILNNNTASTICSIAQYANHDVSVRTMKFAKETIRKMFKERENCEGVEITEVEKAFVQILDARTISEFRRRLCLLEETMKNVISELAFNKRVYHTIRIANRDHGVWLNAEQVIEAANGNRYFNFTKLAAELAEKTHQLNNYILK